MSEFAETFPALVFIGLSLLGVCVLITRGKLSRGSRSAGPILAPRSSVHGQSETTWDAAAVSEHLARDVPSTCQMMAGLCQTAGVSTETPYGQTLRTIEVLVDRLEEHYHLTRGDLSHGDLARSSKENLS